MAIKNVIFDFDGTLANTLTIVEYSLTKIFQKYEGRDITHEEFLEMCGPSETGIIEEYFTKRDKVEEAITELFQLYEEEHDRLVQKFSFIDELHSDLVRAEVRLGIFTGKTKRTLEISLAKLNFDHIFDVMITGDDVKQSKPSPEGLLLALEALNAKREETIFIGDSEHDMQAGASAKVRTIGAQWMPAKQSTEYEHRPEQVFYDVADLRTFFSKNIANFSK